jgi:putative ABC transport system permease protein
LDLGVGDRLKLRTPDGSKPFTVFGVYLDFGATRGEVMMGRRIYARLWDDADVNTAMVRLGPEVDVQSVVDDWRPRLQRDFPVVVHSYAWIKAETRRIFNRTFRVTDILGLLSAVVAFCGLAGSLLALSMARRREYSVMTAVGMSPKQTTGWVLGEGFVIALAASLVASVAGSVLAMILAYVIQYRSFGWSIPVNFQPWAWVIVIGYACGSAMVAGWYPLRRLRRQAPASGLREE